MIIIGGLPATGKTTIAREAWRQVALDADTPFLEVELICPDGAAHQRRVEGRTSDIEGLKLPNWAAVQNREYEAWNRDHLVVDTAVNSVDESLAILVAALHHP